MTLETTIQLNQQAIAQQHYTLALLPQLECIYFCRPDMKGFVCYQVTRNKVTIVSDHSTNNGEFLEDKFKFRKPGAGVIYRAANDFEIDLTKSWMIGDRDEDEKAAMSTTGYANAAGVNFMWAIFAKKFAYLQP